MQNVGSTEKTPAGDARSMQSHKPSVLKRLEAIRGSDGLCRRHSPGKAVSQESALPPIV